MHCHDEVSLLERRLRHLTGFEDLSANVVTERLIVRHDAAQLSASAIADAVADTGMRAWLEADRPGAAARPRRAPYYCLGLSAAFLLAGAWLELSGGLPQLVAAACAVAIASGGTVTARKALGAVRARSLDINSLMLIAVLGAVLIGEWLEGATVVFLFALAQVLESRSMERARGAIRSLMDLAPVRALVRADAGERETGVEHVQIGEVIIVRPGERFPLDGRVVAGESEVNQAPLTGESLPVSKSGGDQVLAGTINGRGALDVEVTRAHQDTTIARIIDLVERAQSQRAPMQLLVDRFARRYTPAIIALAVALAVLPPLVAGAPAGTWFYRALVLLVMACPCALVISTPVSIVSALAGAARRGVLIKGGLHLERTAIVRCVAFDKTGTLTRGRLDVVDVVALDGRSPSTVLALAASLEMRAAHPIAHAIVRGARGRGLKVAPGEMVQSIPGMGAEGQVDGVQAVVGNHRLFHERGLCSPEIDMRLEELAARGRTAVLVASAGRTIGILGMTDLVRETGPSAIEELRRQGIERLVLLTGDNATTARVITRDLHLDEFRAELLPEDKLQAVAELRSRYGAVAMVGDGINDTPALAASDVGVAMGAAGSDAALETADIALMSDELRKLPFLVRLSRATRRTIVSNIIFSVAMKAGFLVLGVAGLATLWMAVVADMGASLLVVANGLRLRYLE